MEQLFRIVGLPPLAYFRSIFPFFLKWMQDDDDDEIVLAVMMHIRIQ